MYDAMIRLHYDVKPAAVGVSNCLFVMMKSFTVESFSPENNKLFTLMS